MTLNANTSANIQKWLDEDYDLETKKEIRRLLDEKSPDLENAFYKPIEFGTGGMRGLMGVGTNRMNVYTLRKAAQGLANYIKQLKIKKPSILIGYDARLNSHLFAEEAARVFIANDIHVYFFKEIRPTPLVSFGCRFKAATAAIMVTASHNPPAYNGFKVYWSDGGQVLPPHDIEIVNEVNKIDHLSEIKRADSLDSSLFEEILEEVDQAYLNAQEKWAFLPQENKKYGSELKLLYTSLHGTGITLMPSLLKRWGFASPSLVEKQCVPDGNFTYAPVPNPEEQEALKMGSLQLLEEGHDLLIATDPDADRIGVVVRHNNQAQALSGNEIAALCLWHIVKQLDKKRGIVKKPAFVKSIVTTELLQAISDKAGYPLFDVLTGFKYIAEVIRTWEMTSAPYQFIFGAEESYGYLLGDNCRDKDALISGALIAEMALVAKRENKTLVDRLMDLFQKFGLFVDILHNIKLSDSKESLDKMNAAMSHLRTHLPSRIGTIAVKEAIDYQSPLKGHSTNMIRFNLEDGTKLVLRPSGTEPKMKIYCGLVKKEFKDLEKAKEELEKRGKKLIEALQEQIGL